MSENKVEIDEVKLQRVMEMDLLIGSHASIEDGLCVMEAVAYVAGERWSDNPACASPVIAAFLRAWNDRLPDDERQSLKQYIPLLVGSKASPEIESQRSWMLRDWVVRDRTPRWLRRAGMNDQAAILEGMAPIVSSDDYASMRPAIQAILEETWAKRRTFLDALLAEFKKRLPKTDAAAYAAADAAAYAAADADAYAAAAADADAYAYADAAAAAYADADAAADADAGSRWSSVYNAVKEKLRAVFKEKLADTRAESQASAHAMLKRLVELP